MVRIAARCARSVEILATMYTRQWQVFTAIRRRTARLCSADTSEPHFGTYATEKNSPSQAISAPTAARAILEFFPRLKHTKLVRTWGGMMDECADKVPVIDTCKEVEGLAIACGFTGHGFGIGSITGLLLSELLLDVKTSTLPIDAFRYDRF